MGDDAAQLIAPDMCIGPVCQMSLEMCEEDRLRLLAKQTPSDPYAMAAYGSYLRYKKGDALNGNRWEQRALELLASRRASVKELFP